MGGDTAKVWKDSGLSTQPGGVPQGSRSHSMRTVPPAVETRLKSRNKWLEGWGWGVGGQNVKPQLWLSDGEAWQPPAIVKTTPRCGEIAAGERQLFKSAVSLIYYLISIDRSQRTMKPVQLFTAEGADLQQFRLSPQEGGRGWVETRGLSIRVSHAFI